MYDSNIYKSAESSNVPILAHFRIGKDKPLVIGLIPFLLSFYYIVENIVIILYYCS